MQCRWLFLIFVQISWTKSSMKSWVFINNLLHTSGLKSSVNCYCNCNVSRRISISLLTLLPKFLECVKSFILDINWGYLPTLGNAQWREYHFFQPIWCWKMIWALILDAIKIVITPLWVCNEMQIWNVSFMQKISQLLPSNFSNKLAQKLPQEGPFRALFCM